MTLQWLLVWWNLIFILPFGLALLFLGLYTLTGISFGDADADVGEMHLDADLDGDVHLDGAGHVDADADADVHVDGPGHAETDAHGDTDSEGNSGAPASHGATMSALQWLGVGRAPITIVLMILLLTWGWIGFVTNVLLHTRIAPGLELASVSMAIAGIGSILFTKSVIGILARWLPTVETNARRRHELLGSVGEAMYAINETFGMSSIRDAQGDLYQVPCRVGAGEPVVAKGQNVKLVAYNAKEGIFQVIPWGNGRLI